MPDLTFILLFGAFAFLLAGFVKGILGQGLPTVAVGLLSLVMSPGEATALLLLPAIVTNIWQGLAGPATVMLLRRLWPTLLASVAGTWVATVIGLGPLTPEAAAVARQNGEAVELCHRFAGSPFMRPVAVDQSPAAEIRVEGDRIQDFDRRERGIG